MRSMRRIRMMRKMTIEGNRRFEMQACLLQKLILETV